MTSFKILIAMVVGVISVIVCMVLVLSETENPTVVEPVSYVVIGNNIQRTDDLEKGVSCYKTPGGAMSCVLTRGN